MQNNQIQVNIKDAEDVKCESCENLYFKPVFRIKRLSPLVSPNGKEAFIPVQLLACIKCEHINKDMDEV
jgi:hypothetical protein|tara:strand:- start:174 stop:380 length:207 start_codon:yes stop_codon:yes gene_type:complete